MKSKKILTALLLVSLVSCGGGESINSSISENVSQSSNTSSEEELILEDLIQLPNDSPYSDLFANLKLFTNGWPTNRIKNYLRSYDLDKDIVPSFSSGVDIVGFSTTKSKVGSPLPDSFNLIATYPDDNSGEATVKLVNDYIQSKDSDFQAVGVQQNKVYFENKNKSVELEAIVYGKGVNNPTVLMMSIIPTSTYPSIDNVFPGYKNLTNNEEINKEVNNFIDELALPTNMIELSYKSESDSVLSGYAYNYLESEGLSIVFSNKSNLGQTIFDLLEERKDFIYNETAGSYGYNVFDSYDGLLTIQLVLNTKPNYLQLIITGKDLSNKNHGAFYAGYSNSTTGFDTAMINAFLNSYSELESYSIPTYQTTNTVYSTIVDVNHSDYLEEKGDYLKLFIETSNDYETENVEYINFRNYLTSNGFTKKSGFNYYTNEEDTIHITLDYTNYSISNPTGLKITIAVASSKAPNQYSSFFDKLEDVYVGNLAKSFNTFITTFGLDSNLIPDVLPDFITKNGIKPHTTSLKLTRFVVTLDEDDVRLRTYVDEIAQTFIDYGYEDKTEGNTTFLYVLYSADGKVRINIGKVSKATANEPAQFTVNLTDLTK